MRLSFPALSLVFILLAPACGPSAETIALERLAAQGDKIEQFNLGVRYATGNGAPLDYAKAVEWYVRAAEQGLAEAQYNLGMIYWEGRAGVTPDLARADKWFTRAAKQGVIPAKTALLLMYTGRAIEALQAGDHKKAREWSAKGEATRKKLNAMDERRKQTPA